MKKGFTLIELLIVMVLLGLTVSVVIPNIGAGLDKMKFRGEVKKMTILLRKIRFQSQYYHKTVRLKVGEGRLIVDGLELETNEIPAVEVALANEIVFYANGVSSGGQVDLVYKQRSAIRLLVERFSGKVSRQVL